MNNITVLKEHKTEHRWVRQQIKKLKTMIGNCGGSFPLPMLEDIPSNRLNHNQIKTITVTGSYFTKDSIVTIPGLTVNSVNILSAHLIEIEVTANSEDGLYDLIVSNEAGETVLEEAIEVKLSTWLDLREGGENFTIGNEPGNDIRHRSGMTALRDSEGMYFTGANPWSSWVKFEREKWTRGENKTLQWIISKPTSNMMIGIGSDATNETNTAQYQQAETEVYFQNANTMWGLYGNNGTVGSAGNQNMSTALGNNTTFKLKFEGDGGVGSTFTLYAIQNEDWDDESNVLTSFTIGGTLNPNENTIMPFFIPQNGGAQRFKALKIN